MFYKAILILLLSVILFSCNKSSKQNSHTLNNSLSIVTTTFPCFDAVRAVSSDTSNIKLLISPGLEVHNYDPSVADIMAVENCNLFVYIGGESDEWVKKILKTTPNINALRLMDYVTPITDDDGEYDEHIWLDPKNESIIITAVANTLAAITPIDKTHATSYIAQVQSLDKKLTEVTKNIKTPILVADRFPFAYFTRRYGLSYIAAFAGCSSTTEPNTKTLIDMCNAIRQNNIKCAYYIELSNHKMAQMIKNECDVELRQLHSMQNVTRDEFLSGDTYITLMERNINALVK